MSRRLQGIHAAARKDWYRIVRNEATDNVSPPEATVYIYAPIGDSWWGDSVTAADFAREFAALDVERINLHINSPGGDVYDGIAISNAIRQHKATVIGTVDGIAASAASFIAVSCDELVMYPNTELMIHDAWGICVGNAAEMADAGQRLDKISDNIAAFYADKAGGDVADWRKVMLAETWYSAEEAVTAGLADRVAELEKTKGGDDTDAPTEKASFDLSVFAHAGRRDAPRPTFPARVRATQTSTSAAGGGTTPNPEGADMESDTLNQGLRQRLGIAPDAEIDETGVFAALDERLTQSAAPKPADGTVTVDKATWEQTQADARDGREARAQQVTERRTNLVNAAVQDGRILPARAAAWEKALAADPEGAEKTLAELEKGLLPLEPNGYTGGIAASPDDDRLFELAFGRKES